MTQIRNLVEAEQVLSTYIPQVRELLGKDLTLIRMQPMLDLLGNPQNKLRVIHVAGTSGKTSTTYYIASLLKQAGQKVGHTVSPYVDSITERLQINLEPLPEAEFCQALGEFLEIIKDVDPRPTYFELMIAFVYWYFAKAQVDYAVIETGLGGRFDATNVVQNSNKICVITDIGLDHTNVLGSTLPEIAGQKAGIIGPGNQVFMHHQSPAVMRVFEDEASKQNSILNVLSIMVGESGEAFANLPAYQQRNWQLAKAVYDYTALRDTLPTLDQHKLAASMQVQVPGRMDAVRVNGKTVVMDGAHNGQKTEAFVNSFTRLYPNKKAAVLLALKEGKEYELVLPLLKPICSQLLITSFSTAQNLPVQSIDPSQVAKAAKQLGFERVAVEPDCQQAFQNLQQGIDDTIIITGSFYLLSSLRPYILKHND